MDDQAIIDRYREWQRTRGLSPETLRCYREVHRPFIAWLGTRGLTLLTVATADIAEWVEQCGARCNRTRSIYVTRIDLLFRWMADEEIRGDVPSRRIPKPKFPSSLPRPIATDDLHRAMAAADPRVGLMLALAAYAGLRRAEIAGLRREAIHDREDPPVILCRGKGDKERTIPLSAEVVKALERYEPPARGPLFPGPDVAEPLSAGYVGVLISRHLRACGIDATAHRGRHWFGTEVYRASLDLRLTGDLMGHANVQTTAGYAAFAPDRASTAVGALPSRPAPPEAA